MKKSKLFRIFSMATFILFAVLVSFTTKPDNSDSLGLSVHDCHVLASTPSLLTPIKMHTSLYDLVDDDEILFASSVKSCCILNRFNENIHTKVLKWNNKKCYLFLHLLNFSDSSPPSLV